MEPSNSIKPYQKVLYQSVTEEKKVGQSEKSEIVKGALSILTNRELFSDKKLKEKEIYPIKQMSSPAQEEEDIDDQMAEEMEGFFSLYQKEMPPDSPFIDTDLVIFDDQYKGKMPLNGIKEKDLKKITEKYKEICSDQSNIKIDKSDSEFLNQIQKEIKTLLTREVGRELILKLTQEKEELSIKKDKQTGIDPDYPRVILINPLQTYNYLIEMHPSGELRLSNSRPLAIILGHELIHASHGSEMQKLSLKDPTMGGVYDTLEEQVTITGFNKEINFYSDESETKLEEELNWSPISYKEDYDPINERTLTNALTKKENIWHPRFGHGGTLAKEAGIKNYVQSLIKGNLLYNLKELVDEENRVNRETKEIPADSTLSLKNKKILFQGTQEWCDGSVSIAKVEAIRERLEKTSAQGIAFNKNKVLDAVDGGTCTAMSLEFVDRFLKVKKGYLASSNYGPGILTAFMEKIGKQFATSSERMRTRQAAYNTIEVTQSDPKIDVSQSKIQSLAKYHGLEVKYSSKEMDVPGMSEMELESEMQNLPEGAYLVRMIRPADKEKLEESGHSLIYIKEKDVSLFYDPNKGLKNLEELKHSSVLLESFKLNFEKFHLTKVRFYQLECSSLKHVLSDVEELEENEILGVDEALQEIALEDKNLECIKYFIDNDPSFLHKTIEGLPLLSYVAKKYWNSPEYIPMLTMLHDAKLDINVIDKDGNSLFHYMMANQDEQGIKKFVEWNGNIQLKNKEGKTAEELFLLEIEEDKKNYEYFKNQVGYHPHRANNSIQCLNSISNRLSNNYQLMKIAFKDKYDDYIFDNFKNKEDYNVLKNILIFCSDSTPYNLIENYVKNKKEINVQDKSGNTLLHYLLMNGNLKAIEHLLSANPNVTLKNNEGFTPITKAIQEMENSLSFLDKLIEDGNGSSSMANELKYKLLDIAECIKLIDKDFVMEEESANKLMDVLVVIQDANYEAQLLGCLGIRK